MRLASLATLLSLAAAALARAQQHLLSSHAGADSTSQSPREVLLSHCERTAIRAPVLRPRATAAG